MCGIVGYLGRKSVVPLILNSLQQLEYRGYDSAGLAILEPDETFSVYKASGKLLNLRNILPAELMTRNGPSLKSGIGHIRWATHGAPNDTNAHPHVSAEHQIVLVHNGIIENFTQIRKELQSKGYTFQSETDTECVAHLLEDVAKNNPHRDFLDLVRQTMSHLHGAYAIVLMNQQNPNHLYVVRNHAPLVIGVGDGEFVVASDTVAIAEHTNKIIFLKDGEVAEITPDGVRLMNMAGELVPPIVEQIATGPLQIDKKGFKHFMLKEIYEQPDVVRNSLMGRLISAEEPIALLDPLSDKAPALQQVLTQTNRMMVIGCGTSFNAGLVGKYAIEELVRIPVEVEAAGEFRYRHPVINDQTLIVAISQSGETADTLEAIRLSKAQGAKVVVITNREDSTIARESDFVLPVRAGVEVSVCATKSFTAQVVVLYLIALAMSEQRQVKPVQQLTEIKRELFKIPTLIESVLSDTHPFQEVAKRYGNARDVLFIARGVNFPVALEGALKLKEISYIHAEGYSGSELKHGPIAMLDASIPVVSLLVPGGIVFDKMISNCQEVKARDAKVIAVTGTSEAEHLATLFDDVLALPETLEILSPLITTLPLQLLAYYMAEFLGKDVDQPRNLAKSVTVE